MTQLEQLRYVDARCSGLPKKSRVPEFLKYLGLQCPKYLRSYHNKMEEVIHDEKLLIHFFQDLG
jgi:hypothetical protein